MMDHTPLHEHETETGAAGLTRRILASLSSFAVAAMLPLAAGAAGESDIALFSSSNGAPPNIMLLLDDSGSMTETPSWCGGGGAGDGGWGGGGWGGGEEEEEDEEDDWDGGGGFGGGGIGCDGSLKWEVMRDAAIKLVETINPPDGSGGYADGARFGIFMFDSNGYGGMLYVPIEDNNTATVLSVLEDDIVAADATPLGISLVDVGRYFAGSSQWGTGATALPEFGTLDYDASTPYDEEQDVDSPMDLECRDSFVIAMSDGEGQTNSGAKYPNANLWATIGDADSDGDETAGSAEEWFDDAAYAMFRTDFAPGVSGTQNIAVHTVAFDLTGPGAALLEQAAENGGGSYQAANAEVSLEAAFLNAAANIFAQIGSFTGATVTASRTEQGDMFLNSWFEPSDSAVWSGHLEAFRVAPSGEIQGVDVISGTTVYVPAVDGNNEIVADPIWDAGEEILDNTSRRIITTNATYDGIINLTTANVTTTELAITAENYALYPNYPGSGINTQSELETAIIRYVYGQDGFDEDGDGSKTDLRATLLGDIFHSTPLLIGAPSTAMSGEDGYSGFLSAYGQRDRVVYVGANDGLLHAFDAGGYNTGDDPMTTDQTENGYWDYGTGEELWGYLPRRLMNELKWLPRNNPRVQYFVDGSPSAADAWLGDIMGGTAKVKDTNEWATVMVTGMRDGARGYLALDVTNPASSTAFPKFLWEFTASALGDAWSQAVITRVKIQETTGYGDHCGADDGDGDCREQWVAIIGGGFKSNADPNDEDFGPNEADANWTIGGKAMYIINLEDGTLLDSVVYDSTGTNGPTEMIYALPGRPSVIDLDRDGFADVVYIGDVGGQMWKWDVSAVGTVASGEVTNWPAGIFFKTPPTDVGGGEMRYRSFFNPPAASLVDGKLYLAFGSGEREDLFYGGVSGVSENNRFYVIRDAHPTGPLAFASVNTETDPDITDVTDGSNLPGASGYYIEVPDGEKFVSEPTVFAGYVIATSFQPDPGGDVCTSAAGAAYLYVFNIATGVGFFDDGTSDVAADRRIAIGSGLPSSPKVSAGQNPSDDVIYIKTSTGEVITVDAPPRPDSNADLIYWRQVF